MYVHGAGEVRRDLVVKPVVVGEPAITGGQRHQLSRARVIEPVLPLSLVIEHGRHARHRLEKPLHLGDPLAAPDVDVGQLMVRHAEGLRRAGVEKLPPELGPHPDEPGLPQRAVQMDGTADLRDAVLREHDDPGAVTPHVLDQLPADGVDGAEVLLDVGMTRPEALQVVIEMWQIDERERRPPGIIHVSRAIGDPPSVPRN